MAISPSEFLNNPNPKTDPTTVPPINSKGTSFSDVLNNPGVSDLLNKGKSSLKGFGDSNFLQNLTTESNPKAVMAANQGFWSELGNGLSQFASDFGLGAIEYAGYTPGINSLINKIGKSDQEFGNIMSDWARKTNEKFGKEIVPVYNNPETKDISEWTFENIGSLGSSLAMLVPVLGEVKALGFVGKAIGGYKLLKRGLAAANGVQEGSQAFSALLGGLDTITSATLSRHIEGMAEGKEQYDKVYEESIAKGFSEDYAKKAANEAAQNTYTRNWPLVAIDMLQFGIAFKSFKNLSRASNDLERKALQRTLGDKIGSSLIQPGSEAFEEGYQYIAAQEASRQAKIKYGIDKEDYSTFPERFKDYLAGQHSDEFWTSTFWGAAGGKLFEATTDLANRPNEKKAEALQSQIKSLLKQQTSVYEKDPIKFAKASDEVIFTQIINAIENHRADDIKNTYEVLKDTKLEGHTEEEMKELRDRADFGLSQLKELSEFYDNVASKNTVDITKYMMLNKANNTLLSKVTNSLDESHTKHVQELSVDNNLDASYSKLLEAETSLKTLTELKNQKDLSINANIIANREKNLAETIKQYRETIKTNNQISDKEIDDKLNKVNKAQLATLSYTRNLFSLHKDQNAADLAKVNTPKGKEELQEEITKQKQKNKDIELANVVSGITSNKSATDIQTLREQAKGLGKEKEFNSAYNSKLAQDKLQAPRIDTNDIASSLKRRWTNNTLLKDHELNNMSQMILKSGGLPEGGTLDENAISAMYNNNQTFRKKFDEYSKNVGGVIPTTKRNVTQQPTSTVNEDVNKKEKEEQEKSKEEQTPRNNHHAWLSQGYQFEYNKETRQFDLSKPNVNNLSSKVDWKYLNSGSIPIGATLNYEYDYSDPFNKDKNENNALIEIVHYDEKGNRHVIGALTAYANNRSYESKEDKEKLKNLRLHLWEYKKLKPESGIASLGTTKLKKYLSSNPWNTTQYNAPLDTLKPEEELVLAVATSENDIPVLNFNGHLLKDKIASLKAGTPGAVYMIIQNPATKEYYPYKLFTRKLSTKPDLLEYVEGIIKKIQTGEITKDEALDDISDIIYIQDIQFQDGNYTLTLGNVKDSSIVLVKEADLKENLGNLVLQVNVTKINKDYNGESYNKQLSKQGFISTDLNPNEHFHSTNIAIEPFSQPKFEGGELKVSGTPLPTPNTTKVAQNKPQAVKNVGTTKLNLGEPKYSVSNDEVNFRPLNEEELKQWFKKNLPQIPVEFVGNTLTIWKNSSHKAVGAFLNGAITIYNGASNKTAYHEAFHAVFYLFLTPEQQQQILIEAKVKYPYAYTVKSDVYITEEQKLEELLADDFATYVETQDDNSLGYNIKQFFKNLLSYLKSLFTNNINIDSLFNRINGSYYKNSNPLDSYIGINYSIKNANPYVQNRRIGMINYQFFKALDELRNEYSLGDLSDLQVLQKINSNPKDSLQVVYGRVYNGLIEKYNEKPSDSLKDVIDNFFVVEDGEITGTGAYYGKAIQDLANFGIRVKENLDQEVELDEEQEANFNFNEEELKQQSIAQKASFVNPKTNLSNEVRKNLRQLEKYKYDKESDSFTQEGLEDDLGFQSFVNFDEITNYLQKNIVDIFDVDDMMNQLEELKYYRPEIYGLLNKLNENEQLKTQFFSNFSKVYIPYYMIQQTSVQSNITDEYGNPEQESRFTLFNANRKSINQLIIDEWNNNLISTFRNDVTNSDGTIDKEKADKYFKQYQGLLDTYRKFKEINNTLASEITTILSKFGIVIEPQVLINEFVARKVYENGKRVEYTPYQNLLNVLSGSQSFNTILSKISIGENPYQGNTIESTSLRKVTGVVARTQENLHQDTIVNGDGNQLYSYISPTFLHKKIQELKTEKGRELYNQNWWFSKNKWLQDLSNAENQELRDWFEVIVLNNLKLDGRDAVEFSTMNAKELAISDINLYDHNGSKEYAIYRTPIITGSSLAPAIRFKKYAKVDIIDAFYQLALAEQQRIQNIATLDIPVKNLSKNGNQFQFVDIFNTKSELLENEPQAKQVIEAWLDEHMLEERQRLTYEEVLSPNGSFNNTIDARRYNSNFKDYQTKFQEYYYNVALAKAMILQLTSVDISFYKNSNDFQKRAGQVLKPTKMINPQAFYNDTITGETYKSIYLIDEVVDGSEITDSQTYITVARRRKIAIGLGEWNENNEKVYQKLANNKAADDEGTFSPLKPFYYNHETLGNWILPVQHKNSEVTLTKNFTKKNPKLDKLRDYMVTNGIDSAIYVSAVKAGEYGAVKIEDLGKEIQHTFQNKYWGIQTEIPNHYLDQTILFGTQVKKLIMVDIPEDAKFFNGTMNKKEFYGTYQKLLTDNIIESYNEVSKEFLDINKIQKILLEEVNDRNLGDSYRKALELRTDSQGNKVFNIPLFDPIFGKRMQNILNSIIRNAVTKQEINGGSFVLASSAGIVKPKTSDSLKIVRDREGNIQYMEVMLPAWMKNLFPRLPNGEIDIEALKDEAPDLLKGFGYFIPTEGKKSMMALNVVGFLPDLEGGIAIFPGELIGISGKDFDKDEVYIMLPNAEVKDGKLQKVKYSLNNKELNKKQRDNAIIDIMREAWSHPENTDQIQTPSNFDTLKELREELNEKLGVNVNANPIFPQSDAAFFERSANGGSLLPIAAVNNTAHANFQHTNVKLSSQIGFDGKKSSELNLLDTLDGDALVSDDLSQYLAAFADNDKEPVAGFLNLNEYTINVAITINSVGFRIPTAIYFLNQPVLQRLVKGYNKLGGSRKAELDAKDALVKKLISIIGEDIQKGSYMLRTSDLRNQITTTPIEKLTKNEAKEQLKVFYTFEKYKELADSLSNLVRATRSDTLGTGKTMADNGFYLNSIDKALKDDNLENQQEVFDLPIIKVSTEKGIAEPQKNLLSKYLPYDGALFQDIIDFASQQKQGSLTSKEVNYLYNQFIHYYVSGFSFFETKEKSDFINKFPEHFNKVKANNKLNQFDLIKYLRYVPINDTNKVARIEFTSGATISNEQRELIRQSWEAMMISDEQEVRKLALNLIKYSFFATNFGFTYSGFSHLIPPSFFENILDKEGNTYRDYMYKVMQEVNSTSLTEPFLQEIYQHQDLKGGERLLPKISFKQITNKSNTKGNITASVMFNLEAAIKSKLILDSLDIDLNDAVKYIRVKNNNGKFYTYKFSGITKDGNIVYNVLPNRGYENHIIEFDKNNKGTESVLSINQLPKFEEKDYFTNVVKSDDFYQLEQEEKNKKQQKADAELNSILRQFASSLGIKIEYVNDLKTRTGQDALGIAKIFDKLIQISQGKDNVNTLPEEVGHFAEAYTRGTGYHDTLMNLVSGTQAYQEVVAEYGDLYKNDQDKLKRETIGKLIGEAIIKKNEQYRKGPLFVFLKALWDKFLSIFKRANAYDLQSEVNTITEYIASQILDNKIDIFKQSNKIKIGEEFYQLVDDNDINEIEEAIKTAIDSIYKKIKLYERTGTNEFTQAQNNVLEKLQKDFAQKNYELGLIRYLANARIELKKVATRYSNMKSSNPQGIEEQRELINQLKAANNYVEGFKLTLDKIAELAPFSKSVNEKAGYTAKLVDKLEKDYLKIGKELLSNVLKEFSTNPNLNIKEALNILEGDISFTQRWLDALAETSDPILGILDKLVKDYKEIGRKKTIEEAKDLIDAQKALEKAGIKSTQFMYERDFQGNLTGRYVTEYNVGEHQKQKKEFFKENPYPQGEQYKNNPTQLKADRLEWNKKIAKWFEENTQPHPSRKEIIEQKLDFFNKEYKNPIVAKQKYDEWINQNIKEIYGFDELGETTDYQYRGELQIPSEKYRSAIYKDIQNTPALKTYYDKATNLLKKKDEQLPSVYKLNGLMPQQRKDFYERLYFVDKNGNKKLRNPSDLSKELRVSIAEAFTRNENDTEFGLTDESGKPINFIPVYFTRKLDNMSQLSVDATSTIIAFGSSANDFEQISKVLGTLELSKDILAEREILTGKFDPVTLFNKKDKKGKPITSSGKESHAYKRYEDYINMVIYGQQQKSEKIKGYDVAKIIDQINRYTALNSLAGNIYSGISNITLGSALERTEAIAGEFYDNKDLLEADKIYTSELVGTIGDIGQRQDSSKLNLWIEHMNTLQNYNREFRDIDAGRNTVFSRLMKESSLFFLNHVGEHYMQTRLSLALAQKTKVKDNTGKEISLWEAFDKVDVGTPNFPSYRLKMKDGLTKVGSDDYNSLFKKSEDGKSLTERDITRFMNRQNFLNKRLHGIYNDVDKSAIQQYALGRMAIMFRKFIKPGWNRRFAKLTYNEEGEIYTEGNYNTTFRFMKGLAKDLAQAKFSLIKNFDNLNQGEKANVLRSLTEVAYMIAAVTLGAVLSNLADDDEDNWALNLAAYEAYRLYSELRFFSSINEFQRILKSPSATVYQFDKINRFLQVWNWSDEYKRGKWEGNNHFERGIKELLPLVGTYYNFRTPEEQLRFYTNNGVTIF